MTDFFPDEAVNIQSSSVPIGSLAKKTAGRQPRSREASSREATSRTKQIDLSHYEKIFEMEQRGRTYMPPEATPPGYAGMWVRTAIYGKTDFNNTQPMMAKGWIPPTADNYPKVGYMNVYGDITDDKSILERPGLLWMVRPLEIHNLEQQYHNKKLNEQRHFIEASRKIGVDHGFVTGRQNGQTVTFTDDPQAQHVASMFGH